MRFKLERRLDIPKWAGVVIPLVSVGFSLLIMGIVIYSYMYSKPSYLNRAIFGALNEYRSNIMKIPDESWSRFEKLLKAGRMKSAIAVPKGKLSSNVSSFALSRLEDVFRATEEAYKFVRDTSESAKSFPKDFEDLKNLHNDIGYIVKAYSALNKAINNAKSIMNKECDCNLKEGIDSFVENLTKVGILEDLVGEAKNVDTTDPEKAIKKLEDIRSKFPAEVKKLFTNKMENSIKFISSRCSLPKSSWEGLVLDYKNNLENAMSSGFNPLLFEKASKILNNVSTYYCFAPVVKVWNDSLDPLYMLHKKASIIEGAYSQLSSALKSSQGVLRSLEKGRTFFVKDTLYSVARYTRNSYMKLEKDSFTSSIFASRIESLKSLYNEINSLYKSLGKPSDIKKNASQISEKVKAIAKKIEEESNAMREDFLKAAEGFAKSAIDSFSAIQSKMFPKGSIESRIAEYLDLLMDTYRYKLKEVLSSRIDRMKLNMAYSQLKEVSRDLTMFLRDISDYYPSLNKRMSLSLDYEAYVFGMEALRIHSSQDIIYDSYRSKEEIDKALSGKKDITKEEYAKILDKILQGHLDRVYSILTNLKKDLKSLTESFGQVSKVSWIAVGSAYKQLFTWPFIPKEGLPDTINYMTPLLFTGLGLVLVFQMKLWNIGAEGQFYVGVITALWLSLFVFNNHPSAAEIPIVLLIGGLAGAAWAAIAGALKAFLNIDEIVSTLMLNYIAFHWMEYLVYGPWKAPTNFPETKEIPHQLFLPTFGTSRVHIGIIIAVSLSAVVYLLMKKTWWGFDLRVIGDNPNAARYAGVNIAKNIVLAMAVSGFFAGLGGATQILGFEHKLYHGYAPGYGYTGIIIAWLARLDPWATILVSFLFGGFLVGGDQIQLVLKLPKAMVVAIEGVILFSLIASEVLFKYKVRVVRK